MCDWVFVFAHNKHVPMLIMKRFAQTIRRCAFDLAGRSSSGEYWGTHEKEGRKVKIEQLKGESLT